MIHLMLIATAAAVPFTIVAVLGGGFYFLRRYVRAVERRSLDTHTMDELRARLEGMEDLVEDLRGDVDRLEQGQEFTSRLLTGGARPTNASNRECGDTTDHTG